MSKLIFVIDDSPTVRKIVGISLCRAGFQVLGFSDGVEAMRWLAGPTGRTPDLIVLDVGLPKMDGYEVARRFKSKPHFARTVIIMLTRRDGLLDRLKGRLAGASEYLIKPCKTAELTELVQQRLGTSTPTEPQDFLDGQAVFELA